MQQRNRAAGHANTARGLALMAWAVCLFTVGQPASAQSLAMPMRIAEGPPGQVLVSDFLEEMVFAVDSNTLAIAWAVPVDGKPMAVGAAGNLILIGNASTHNVEAYALTVKANGRATKLKWEFNLGLTRYKEQGSIQTPSDLSIDPAARLVFVVDSGVRQVKVFDLDGQSLAEFPAPGQPALLSPTAITVDPARQEVLVSDYGDPNGSMFSGAAIPARIMIYTYAGQFVGQINGGTVSGVTLPAEARFERPQGLALNGRGQLFMAESVRGEIVVFDRATGGVVGKIGSAGEGPGELRLPQDVLLTSSGDILVTNSMNARIERLAGVGGQQ